MVTLAVEAAPAKCSLGCVDGYVIDAERNSVTTCKCEERRTLLAAMHEDVRAAKSTLAHAEWVLGHAKDLDRAVLEGAKADVLALARCVQVALKINEPGRLAVMTDRELVKLTTASWREKDPEADSVDERLVWPHIAVIWLGSLRQGPQSSPEMVLDVLRLRREKRHSTWLAYDPQRPCWIRGQEAWVEVEEHLEAHYPVLEVPRIIGASSTPAKEIMSSAKATPTIAATSTSSPTAKARTLVAKVAGVCTICREPIERGSDFTWADGQKNRAHLDCMTA